MKHLIAFVVFIFCNCMLTPSLSALSIGRDGSSYVQDGIEWQKVCYKDSDAGFTGTLPGSPSSGISDGWAFSSSKYNGVLFEFHTELGAIYNPPETEKEFINGLYEVFGTKASISPISSPQKNVKYCAEMIFNNENKIGRVFCSENRLYWAIVDGADLSLAPFVFDSFQVTQ